MKIESMIFVKTSFLVQMSIWEYKVVAYFGLMHMIATNLCVWLYVIVEETKHEIIHFLLFHENNSASNNSLPTLPN